MTKEISTLPDFFSVRNCDQIEYSLDGIEDKKCYLFFDNGFISNVIEPNKRDIRFIWDGFILFVDSSIDLEKFDGSIDLYDARLVALQRTTKKLNDKETRNYIIEKLSEKDIPFQIMHDINIVNGYPSKCDLWSTRDKSVLIDATECTGEGICYYFENSELNFRIQFNQTNIPDMVYKHKGALVLKGENETAISRFLSNNEQLNGQIKELIGIEKVFSHMQKRYILGSKINKLK